MNQRLPAFLTNKFDCPQMILPSLDPTGKWRSTILKSLYQGHLPAYSYSVTRSCVATSANWSCFLSNFPNSSSVTVSHVVCPGTHRMGHSFPNDFLVLALKSCVLWRPSVLDRLGWMITLPQTYFLFLPPAGWFLCMEHSSPNCFFGSLFLIIQFSIQINFFFQKDYL